MTDSGFGLIRTPTEILFGTGTISALPRRISELGRRALICVDPALEQSPAFREALAATHRLGVETAIVAEVRAELPVEVVTEAALSARSFAPDVVVGYGGGSSLDLAKLVSLLVTYEHPVSTFYGENSVPGAVLPIVAVPTTAGTGSEVTPVAVMSDPARELKVGISSSHLIPRVAIVDPALTLGAPQAVMAHAGADALVHAVEAVTAHRPCHALEAELPVFVGRNDLSSVLALEAVRQITENLPRAVAEPDELAPRVGLALGSLLAGIAFGSAGTHLSHAIQYPVGALTQTPHGLGTGLLLPHVLTSIMPEATAQIAAVGRAMGISDADEESLAKRAVVGLRVLFDSIGIPRSLAEIGLADIDLPRVVELASSVKRLAGNAPGEASPSLIASIVDSAFNGEIAG